MSPSHSITRCIDMLKRGDRAAAEALWDSYIHRLVALARVRLGGIARRAGRRRRRGTLVRSTAFTAGRNAASLPGSPIATTSGRSSC